MKAFLLLLTLQLSATLILAQSYSSAAAAGMGDVAVASTGGISLFHNQAGLAKVEEVQLLAGMERRFQLSELDLVAAGVVVPTNSGTFAIQFQHFGFEEFNRQQVGLAYSRQLFGGLRIGGQLDYFETRIREYGRSGSVTFQTGIQAVISDQLVLGTHVYNPLQNARPETSTGPARFRMGGEYLPSSKVRIGFELEKHLDFPMQFKAGFCYRPVEKVSVRAGYKTRPSSMHVGFGFMWKERVQIDLSGSYHQLLGFSPGLGLQYGLAKGD